MKDFFGNALKEGDQIAYLSHSRTSSSLNKGKIVGFTPCFVLLDENGWNGKPLKVSPEKTIKRAVVG